MQTDVTVRASLRCDEGCTYKRIKTTAPAVRKHTFRKKPRVSSWRALSACCRHRRRTRSKPWSCTEAGLTAALPWMARRVSPLTFSTIVRPEQQSLIPCAQLVPHACSTAHLLDGCAR